MGLRIGECNTADVGPHCFRRHTHRYIKCGGTSCRDRYRRRRSQPVAGEDTLRIGHQCCGYSQGCLDGRCIDNRKCGAIIARKDPPHGPLVVYLDAS